MGGPRSDSLSHVFDGALDKRLEDRQVDIGETLDVETRLDRSHRAAVKRTVASPDWSSIRTTLEPLR